MASLGLKQIKGLGCSPKLLSLLVPPPRTVGARGDSLAAEAFGEKYTTPNLFKTVSFLDFPQDTHQEV